MAPTGPHRRPPRDTAASQASAPLSLSFVGRAGTKPGDLPPRPPHSSVTTGLSCGLFILRHRHTARRGLRSVGPRLLKIKIELVKLMQRLLLYDCVYFCQEKRNLFLKTDL